MAQQATSGLGRLIAEVFRSHLNSVSRTPLIKQSARNRNPYLQNTQQWTNIHVVSGIRNGDPSDQEAADLYLTPHGHRERLQTV